MSALIETGLANAVCAAGLALIVLAIGRICRRPAVMHGLWLLVLLKLVTPPLLPVPVRVLPAPEPQAVAAAPVVAEIATTPDEPAMVGRFLFLPSTNEDEILIGIRIESAVEPRDSPRTTALPPVPESPPVPAAVDWRIVARWLVGIWAIGASAWFLLAAARMARFQRLLRFGQPAPAELRNRAE